MTSETIRYIFGKLDSCEQTVKNTFKRQARKNRTTAFFISLMILYIIFSEMRRMEQNERIMQLSQEIADLKPTPI